MIKFDQQGIINELGTPWTRSLRKKALVCWMGGWGPLGLLGFLQHNHVEVGRFFPLCGFKQRTDLPCPTCGMTTSVLAFTRGQVFAAFTIQPAAALGCTMMVIIGGIALWIAITGRQPRWVEKRLESLSLMWIGIGCAIVIALGWAYTLVKAVFL